MPRNGTNVINYYNKFTFEQTIYLSGEIEKWGTGIKNVYKKCKEENLKVKFEDRKTAFFVVVYRKDLEGLIENTEKDLQGTKQFLEKFPEQFLENERKILESIRNKPNITQIELSNNLGISTRAVRKNMKNLKDSGIIERVGSDRKGYWILNKANYESWRKRANIITILFRIPNYNWQGIQQI